MARRDQVKAMKEVVKVRGIQQLAARMGVARADAALRMREQSCKAAAQAAVDDQADWERVVTSPSLSLSLASAWAGQVEQSQTQLVHAQTGVAAAEDEKSSRIETWRASLARAEAAEELSTSLFRRARRQRDEAVLAELTDKISRRRAVT